MKDIFLCFVPRFALPRIFYKVTQLFGDISVSFFLPQPPLLGEQLHKIVHRHHRRDSSRGLLFVRRSPCQNHRCKRKRLPTKESVGLI